MNQRQITGMFRIEDLLGMGLMLFLIGFCCFQFADEPPTRAVSYASFVRTEPVVKRSPEPASAVDEPTAVGLIRDDAGTAPLTTLEMVRECSPEHQARLERMLGACRG